MSYTIKYRYTDATHRTGSMTVPTARDVTIYTERLKKSGCVITSISPPVPDSPGPLCSLS
ncbi:MAG: hypothetical protein KGI03_03895 [Patescibacteria group bacterium]|nr:hypothetical protein [Patescibacteria group bacterium]